MKNFLPQNKNGTGCIYRIINLTNSKMYIRQTRCKYTSVRWNAHIAAAKNGNNRPLYRAMRKYGVHNFKYKIMLINIPINQLDFYEKLWIKKLNTLNPNGYNLTERGSMEGLTGEKSPTHGKAPWNKGIPRSQETKEKIKQSWTKERKEQYSKYFSGTNNPMYEKHPTGLSRYGKDNPFFGKKHTEETKQKIKNSSKNKQVACYDIETEQEIKNFFSLHEAAEWVSKNTKFTNADKNFISRCAKGKHKYAYGYKWKFKK